MISYKLLSLGFQKKGELPLNELTFYITCFYERNFDSWPQFSTLNEQSR